MSAQVAASEPHPSPAIRAWLSNGDKRMLIGDAWVTSTTGETFETCDPATGAVLAHVPLARVCMVI